MTVSAIISVLGMLGQLFVAAFFFGQIRQSIRDLAARADRSDSRDDRADKRVDTIELRLNDHTERIAKIEARQP